MEAKQIPVPHSLNEKDMKWSIPDPVSYKPIQFYDEGQLITYTDCWEISVLRFLHLVFGKGEIINQENLKQYMDLNNQNCQKLLEYFSENPTYKKDSSFYTTKEGLEIRAVWCQFLNNSRLFHVKLKGKYEVAATVPNLLLFFKSFFPKLEFSIQDQLQISYQNIKNKSLFMSYQKLLNQIYEQLSFNFKVRIQLESNYTTYGSDYLFFSSIQKIYLDGVNLVEWEIYQFDQIKESNLLQRQSGHSDYRYSSPNK